MGKSKTSKYKLIQAKTPDEIKSLTVTNVKTAYNTLAESYNKLINLDMIYCPYCGEFKSSTYHFYTSDKTADGIEHFACKSCILEMCTDYDEDLQIRIDNRLKTIETFRKLDLPFYDRDYNAQLQTLADGFGIKSRATAAQQLITMVKSLPQYKGKTFKDSEFEKESGYISEKDIELNEDTILQGKKRFGNGFSNEELLFLENEYQDWISRYECSQKAQEEVFQNLSILKLMRRNAIKRNKSTKDIDDQTQKWLDTGNLKPKQNSLDTLSDAQTMGTLIQKYEETRPLPDIDPELQDVDKIGTYIDAFYRGHASKMLGLKNRFSNLYERIMAKYTVKPPSYDEDEDSEAIFDKIFGNKDSV